MRRVLYAVLLLALLIPVGSAFAEPQVVEQIPDGQWILGEIWWTPDNLYGADIWEPFERVDAYLTRPAAVYPDGWPFAWGPEGIWMDVEPWWWSGPQSQQRRMSYAEDWLYATEWGGYYAEFLLPRDEVWYPCSFPLKWKCDYEVAPNVWVYHAPQVVVLEGLLPVAFEPADTISPLVIDIMDAEMEWNVQYQLEIVGYTWYASDIN